jgi:hypothetical protein
MARRATLSAFDRVPYNKHEHCANHSDEQAIQIQAGHTAVTECVEQPTTDDRADDSQDDVEENAFAAIVDNFASDETSQESEDDPSTERHDFVLLAKPRSLLGGDAMNPLR